MGQEEALRLCRKYGAFYDGHFIGTQGSKKGLGLHMPVYFDSRTLITHPKVIGKLAAGMAALLKDYRIDTIVGMPIGALTLGSEVAKALGARYAMAEKSGDEQVIERSAFIDVVADKRVAIVEDTLNDGQTIRQGIKAIQKCGGNLVAIVALVNRGSTTSQDLGVPLHQLIRLPMQVMTREECLADGQCSRGEPINRKPGHGYALEQLIATGAVPKDPRLSFL